MTIFSETLVPLREAAEDFNGVKVPLATVKRWAYTGYCGLRLETVSINKVYTSKEAILRFLEQKQKLECHPVRSPVDDLTPAQIEKELKRHGIID